MFNEKSLLNALYISIINQRNYWENPKYIPATGFQNHCVQHLVSHSILLLYS